MENVTLHKFCHPVQCSQKTFHQFAFYHFPTLKREWGLFCTYYSRYKFFAYFATQFVHGCASVKRKKNCRVGSQGQHLHYKHKLCTELCRYRVTSACQVSKFAFHLFHLGGNTWNSATIPYLRTQREHNDIGHTNSSSSMWSRMIEKWKLCIMFQRFQCVIPKCAKIRLMLAEPALHLNTSEVNERAFLHLQFPYSSHHIHPVGQSILLLSHKSWCNKDQTRVGTLDGIRIRPNISI